MCRWRYVHRLLQIRMSRQILQLNTILYFTMFVFTMLISKEQLGLSLALLLHCSTTAFMCLWATYIERESFKRQWPVPGESRNVTSHSCPGVYNTLWIGARSFICYFPTIRSLWTLALNNYVAGRCWKHTWKADSGWQAISSPLLISPTSAGSSLHPLQVGGCTGTDGNEQQYVQLTGTLNHG